MQINDLLFIKEIDLLKTIERQSPIFNGSRRENSAEHSWHLATSVFIFKNYTDKKIDMAKALGLALFHDVVEIDAGDTFVYGDLNSKAELELKTLERLIALLPQNTAEEIKSLWLEYEDNLTNEAQYVNALDRFLPIYANFLSKGYSWKKHGIKKTQVIDRNKEKIMKGLPKLWDIVEVIMKNGIEEGYLVDL